jgi:hypothetical protein
MTGQTIAKVVDAETGNIQRLVEPAVALSVPNGYPATSGAWLGYHLPESAEVMLVNLLSGERQALPVDADRVDAIHWYPDGERALVYLEKGDCSRLACERDVWYFSRPDNAFEQVLAGGEAVDTPGALNQFSPDGQRTLLLSENYQIYLFDAPELEPLFEDDVPLSLKVQRWNWHDESTVLLSGHPSDKGLLLDLAADTYQVLGEGGPHYLSFNSTELSSSGRYIVWPGPFDIIDRQTGSRVSISPHPGLSEGRLPADYGHWHPDEPWVIMAANNAVAGGGVGRKLMSVANADGTIVRHFDHSCWFFLNCLQWLPASVDVERLP